MICKCLLKVLCPVSRPITKDCGSLATKSLQFLTALSTILSALARIVRSLLWVNMSTIHSPFSTQLTTCNYSSVLIVLHQFFSWIAMGDVDLCFSLILIIKSNTDEGSRTASSIWLYHQCIQSIHVTDSVTVMSLLLASNVDHLCQIALNQKLSHIKKVV